MKSVSKKIRLMLIDRFFIQANELPHEIKYSHSEDGWKIFVLKSSNCTHEIGYKTLFNQIALFS